MTVSQVRTPVLNISNMSFLHFASFASFALQLTYIYQEFFTTFFEVFGLLTFGERISLIIGE